MKGKLQHIVTTLLTPVSFFSHSCVPQYSIFPNLGVLYTLISQNIYSCSVNYQNLDHIISVVYFNLNNKNSMEHLWKIVMLRLHSSIFKSNVLLPVDLLMAVRF